MKYNKNNKTLSNKLALSLITYNNAFLSKENVLKYNKNKSGV